MHFTKFYRTFRRKLTDSNVDWSNIDFNNFKQGFLLYKPEYNEDSPNALVVKVLINFLVENPEYHDNVYLATVYADASFEYSIAQQSKLEIDDTFVHNHVAAILKINFNNTDGYIVMDPIRGLITPIVVMEDNYYFITQNMRDKSAFRMLPCLGLRTNGELDLFPPYIIQSHTTHVGHSPTNHLYYIRKSFCSMMYLTYKNDLLKPFRSIDSSNMEGVYIARIYTDLLQNETDKGSIFTVHTNLALIYVAFEDWSLKTTKARVDRIVYDAGAPYMGYADHDIYNKKITYMGALSSDRLFIDLYKQLIQNQPVYNPL